MTASLRTPLCDQLGIDVPVISAGMGPIAGPDLVAAVSNAGGLGVLGCTSMTPDEVRAVIRRTRELTDRPFGVDLILPSRIEQGGAKVSDVAAMIPDEHKATASRIADELGVEQPSASDEDRNALGTDAEAQVEVILEEGVPVFVGALGSPGFVADRFHDVGATVISIVGSTKQAVAVVKDGADVVIAQGTEGGGHTGHVGTMPCCLRCLMPLMSRSWQPAVSATAEAWPPAWLWVVRPSGLALAFSLPRRQGSPVGRRPASWRPPISPRSSAGPIPASVSGCCQTTGPGPGRKPTLIRCRCRFSQF